MKYKIMTEGRKYYVIDEQNRICRTDVKFTPTDNWRRIGVREVLAFGHRGPIVSNIELSIGQGGNKRA